MSKTKRIAIALLIWVLYALVIWGIQVLNSQYYQLMLWDNLGKVWFFVAGVFVPLFPFLNFAIDTLGEEDTI